MTELPPRLTRRNLLQLLFTLGGGLAAAELLRALQAEKLHLPSRHFDRIKNIVFFIQENHSFDNLFAGFPGANGKSAEQKCPDALHKDPPHEHVNALSPNGATSAEASCSYTETDIPNYWKMARAFTLCDNYFSDVRGPSHPNYLMMTAGQSPIINTPFTVDMCPRFCLDIPVLPNRL